jgi:DegV family protein with EDD domain
MNIAISSESTCDLSQDLLKQYDISTIPYTVILGDEMVEDNENVPARIFEYVEKTGILPKTSAINEETYKEYFSKLLKTHDCVVHITLSGGITSAVEHAKQAAKSLKNVYIVDSKSLSTGIGLLAIYARQLADSGLSAKEIAEKVEARVPYVQASFVIERLDYLYKGGRCNALSLFGANLLKIRPQIVLSNGLMKPAKKYRGKMEKVVENYSADTLAEFNNPDKSIVFITHTTATPEMVNAAKTALEKAGFENIYETTAGGTITSHCGEHVLGILYINDGNK